MMIAWLNEMILRYLGDDDDAMMTMDEWILGYY